MDVVSGVLAGERRAVARALSWVEGRCGDYRTLLKTLAPRLGRAHRIGVTGAPGVGKSTFVSALTRVARARGQKVAIAAVDPTSPHSGGALLGDRVRMMDHVGDEDVFVRSLASRGALGGLSPATGEMLDVLDAAGFDLVIIETVGAGQADIDVAEESDTTLVLFAPGAGDAIQAMKSGLMEVADLWIVNKADDPRADRVRADILSSLSLNQTPADLDERVLLVAAIDGQGMEAVMTSLESRLNSLDTSGTRDAKRSRRTTRRLALASRLAVDRVLATPAADPWIAAVAEGKCTVDELAADVLRAAAQTCSKGPSS